MAISILELTYRRMFSLAEIHGRFLWPEAEERISGASLFSSPPSPPSPLFPPRARYYTRRPLPQNPNPRKSWNYTRHFSLSPIEQPGPGQLISEPLLVAFRRVTKTWNIREQKSPRRIEVSPRNPETRVGGNKTKC